MSGDRVPVEKSLPEEVQISELHPRRYGKYPLFQRFSGFLLTLIRVLAVPVPRYYGRLLSSRTMLDFGGELFHRGCH